MIFGWNGENTPKFCVLRYIDYYTFNYIRNELCCKRDRVATFIYNVDCVDRFHSILDKTISIVLLFGKTFSCTSLQSGTTCDGVTISI